MYRSTPSAQTKQIQRNWYAIDAAQWILGRLGTEVANRLQGKHKAQYTPHIVSGDVIVIYNAEKIQVTGNKRSGKIYYRHTQHPGGIKQICLQDRLKKDSVGVIKDMVKGMLPKGRLGRDMLENLWVYRGDQHPHQAQQPKLIEQV